MPNRPSLSGEASNSPLFKRGPTVRFGKVVNTTGRTVNFYDEGGYIASCEPNCHVDLLEQPLDSNTMVIFEKGAWRNNDNPNIKKKHIVEAETIGTGRLGPNYMVSRLARPDDHARVSFSPEGERAFFTPEDNPEATKEIYKA